jgi:Gpi18-like mannosyltransferase
MALGFSFEVAGTLINNLAFLGALIVLYQWVNQRQGREIAQWSTIVLAWCPFSLFGTVIYTEGLFLLLSTAALWMFDQRKYGWTVLFGGLATATRITGLALIASFLLVAWKEKRSIEAYLTSVATSLGILSYSLYCSLAFQQPLAFLLVQKQFWQPEQDFWGQGWLKMLAQVTVGTANWKQGSLVDPWHPLIFVVIAGLGFWIWQKRQVLSSAQICYSSYGLILILWLLAGNPLINSAMTLGGFALLILSRQQLGRLPWFYGLTSFAILFSSGRTISAERYAYGTVSLAIALGCI